MKEPQFSIEHVGLAARDTVALAAWYSNTLGATVVFQNDETPPAFLLKLEGGIFEIYPSLIAAHGHDNNKLSGWRHIALRVASLDRAMEHLLAGGVALPEPIKPAGGGGRVIFFQDPEGNLLHLVERPAGVSW